MSLTVIVMCDHCDAEGMPGVSRDELREAGWRVRAPGGEDYCPDCRKRPASHGEKRGIKAGPKSDNEVPILPRFRVRFR